MAMLMLPGCGGSNEKHWQTIWQRANPAARRFQPTSWLEPDLEDWIRALEAAIAEFTEPPVLVAHSLSCLLVAHWSARAVHPRVTGAFLVSVPDSSLPDFPSVAGSFRNVPEIAFPFPALVVNSGNDPYGSLDHARRMARAWGATFIVAGELGHINADSGHGEWPLGAILLRTFIAGLATDGRLDS